MYLLLYIFLGFIALIFALLAWLTYKDKQARKYFESHGIPYVQGGWVGVKFMFGGSDMVELEEDGYNKATSFKNAPMVGMPDLAGTWLNYVTDLDLIRNITVKNFDHFVNRRSIQTEHSNKYFKKMVFFTASEQWKGTRSKLSPSFTTGKIRRMFEIFKNSSERMDTYLKEQVMDYPNVKSMDMDFLKLFPKYTMDVIANCAFGIDSKNFEMKPEEKSTFEQMGNRFGFKFTGKVFFKIMLMMIAPKIADLFGVDAMDAESQAYLVNVIKNVLKHRRQTGEKRNDFLQLMMEVQEGILKADEESNELLNGVVEADEEGKKAAGISGGVGEGAKTKVEFDDDYIIANGLAFFMAGFDPTQSSLLFTLYSLATEPEIQQKLYEEVNEVMEKNGGKVSYDGINEMKYLDLVLNESMRFYPPATRTERLCTKDFQVEGTNYVIKKNSVVVLPIHGIHQDPRHFPNPKKFIPERFTPENKAARHPYAYLPFGHGPRNCLGNRFAIFKVKTVLAQLVYSYKFEPCSKTKIPIEFDRNPNVKPKGDMWLNVTVRDKQ